MNRQSANTLASTLLVVSFIFLSAFPPNSADANEERLKHRCSDESHKQEVFKLLETKCNTCHRKQNPFMVFSVKNMEKRARKIHKQVFIRKRMPKGDQVKLTNKEYTLLKEWLLQQNIN